MRISPSDSTLPMRSLSLLLSYILFISLCAPFAIRKVEAASSHQKAVLPVEPGKPSAQSSSERSQGLLVRFRPSLSEQEINTLVESKRIRRVRRLRGQSGLELLDLLDNQQAETVVADLRLDPLVEFAEANYLITGDAFEPRQQPFLDRWPSHHRNHGLLSPPTGVVHSLSTGTGAATVVIAVIDSGIDWTHPDLSGKQWINNSEQINTQDDDQDGFVDDQSGWDFVAEGSNEKDERGHGTAVAGLILSQGTSAANISGVVWQPSLMSLRVLDATGTGDVARAIEAIDYSVAHGAQIINCSWGTNGDSHALRAAIERAAARGVVVVNSAGNEGRDIESTPRYSASFDLPNIIAVASVDNSDQLASWSNWGAAHVQVAASGVDVPSTKAGGGYQAVSGTSVSAAAVSGVAGLIKTLRPQLSAERTREMIMRGARQVSALQGKVAAGGIVNAPEAVTLINTLPPGEGLSDTAGTTDTGSHNITPQDTGIGVGVPGLIDNGGRFRVTPPEPTRGAPGPNLPNLDEMHHPRPTTPPRARPAIPSTHCSPHIHGCGQDDRPPVPPPVDPNPPVKISTQAQPSPVVLLASNGRFPAIETLLGLEGSAVSDSPFAMTLSSHMLSSQAPASQLNAALLERSSLHTNLFALMSQSPPSEETIWVEDQVPTGATQYSNSDTWNWVTSNPTPYSGSSAHQSNIVAGFHNHYFTSATQTLPVNVGDKLFSYVYIDPANVPSELMLQWNDGTTWYNAYWGVDNINWVSNRQYMGGLPAAGGWMRLEVAANLLGVEGRTLSGMAFNAYGGRVTWDRAGKLGIPTPVDQVWVEDSIPTGGVPAGSSEGWAWISTNPAPASGSLAHRSALVAGFHNHYFTSATSRLTISPGDKLFSYVYIDPANVPSELMLQWNDGTTWYNAYWGVDNINWVSNRQYMGGLPAAGGWMRLEVAASVLGAEGKTLSGMAFNAYGGRVTWDRAGKLGIPSAQGDPVVDFSNALIDPINRTGTSGEDLVSGNYNWSLPLVGLTGRAGLDLGLSLSYNSLVWTRSGSSITYDADRGFPSPGFRLGFPIIQQRFYDTQSGSNAYLLITPSGSRVELRQIGTTNVYESVDSSHLQLTDYGGSQMLLQSTDGSRLSYSLVGGEYHCVEIKDRNGNLINVNYDGYGHITTIIDTLGRTLTFSYDGSYNLIKITQVWNGDAAHPHELVTFGYTNLTLQTNFSGLSIVGIQNGTTMPVLSQVNLPDGSYYQFSSTSWGQVWRIAYYARDGHERRQVSYNLPLDAAIAQTDCPRFTERRDWAENWNGDVEGGVAANEEAVTTYSFNFAGGTSQVIMPDATVYKEFFATSGWARGLTTLSEFWSAGVKQKYTTVEWTQDNTSLAYQLNPRPHETHIYDAQNNHRRTRIEYTSYGLASDIYEYESDAQTVLRGTHLDYNLDAMYTDRRLLGLVSMRRVFDKGVLSSKTDYQYDWWGEYLQNQGAATQHATNYHEGFAVGRGNVTSIRRWDVTDPENVTKALETKVGYNTNGSVIFTRDALNHQTTISYLDSFSDSVNRQTFAYPTTIQDADNYISTSQYNYDLGAVTRTADPKGAVQTREYDAAGRLQWVRNLVNGGWQFYAYPDRGDAVQNQTTIQDGAPAYYSITVFDGAERVRAQGGDHPNGTGVYAGSFTLYDVMGRVWKQSNPAEVSSVWVPVGDDVGGWRWTVQSYDWKGRPRLRTNTDGTTMEASYGGCGCAGGEVVTTRDEVGRLQRSTADVLGRVVKREVFNSNGTVYATAVTSYNALDEATNIRQYQGSDQSGVYQDTGFVYDGYGRLWIEKRPEQSNPTYYSYYADDQVQTVQDGRGAVATYSYNARHLVTGISYSAPGGVTAAAAVSYSYDETGHRTQMTDGMGTSTYHYDQLSRMDWEERTISALARSYRLSYTYNLAGQLSSITDPFQTTISYGHDAAGRMTSITGPTYGGISQYLSNMRYRAWGGLKSLAYGNSRSLSVSYNQRMQATHLEVAGVISSDFLYQGDGRVSFASNLMAGEAKFSRSYGYDAVGRVTSSATPEDGPYNQTFGYDEWNNLTERVTYHWGHYLGESASYINNKNPSWGYDGEGRLTTKGSQSFQFDAAGAMTQMYNPSQQFTTHSYGVTLSYGYDGDGRKLKQTKYSPNLYPSSSSIYYLHSSVMGGQVITELRESGEKRFGYIYMGSQEVAREEISGGYGSLTLRHENMVTGSVRRTDTSGAVIAGESVELDSLGNSVGMSDPYPSQEQMDNSDRAYPRFGEPVNQFGGCSVDGVPAPCGYALSLLNNGNAALCPNGDCGAQRVVEDGHARIAPPPIYTNQGVGYYRWVPNSNPRPENPEANTPIEAPPAGSDVDGVVRQNGYGQGGDYEWVSAAGGIIFVDGLQRSTPQNPFPGFDNGKLGDVNKAIAEGAKLLKQNDCQKGLAAAGINVTEMNRIFALLSARPASDPSSKGYNIFYAEKSTDPQLQQFLRSPLGKSAGGFIYGQDIMLRDAFFSAHGGARIAPDISRALALIHEVVHLAGRGDAFFHGSAKLNDVVIHACYSKLYGHNDLSIVGN